MVTEKLEGLIARLEKVTDRLEIVGRSGGGGSATNDDPAWYDDYVKVHDSTWASFLNATKSLGHDDMNDMEAKVRQAFEEHKKLLTIAARNGKPKDADFQQIVKPLATAIGDVQQYRESSRRSPKFNHLSGISEGIAFLGWVTVAPKPFQYVKDMKDSAEFYTNKVLKEFRESDPKQADWAKSFIKLLAEFSDYVKDQHSVGLQWNKDKPPATAASAASAGSVGPPPPPPPAVAPPPPPPVQAPAPSGGGSTDGRSALFAQLNQGGKVTAGLKKVTDDMKTHKNPNLRSQGPVAATKSSALSPRPYSPPQFKKFSAPAADKPPVFELQMKKWIVEWQKNNQSMIIDDTSDKQTVYMYKCTNSVLQIKGKVNSVTLDSCSKCGVVFEDLISTCEFVNCQSIKAQANGCVPTISVEKTDGAQIYLNDKSINAQIITAKSSEMNVCITKPDGDLDEFPIPEQFRTVFDGKKFVTTTMDLNL